MENNNKLEKLFWSIAFPGFGQILNGKIIKAVIFIGLEIIINFKANFNTVIIASFHGDINEAIQHVDYGWLMNYPSVYMFAIWDAYKDAGGGKDSLSFLPFVFSVFFVTVGLIYSSSLEIFGRLLGPLWLPMLCLPLGITVGLALKRMIKKISKC